MPVPGAQHPRGAQVALAHAVPVPAPVPRSQQAAPQAAVASEQLQLTALVPLATGAAPGGGAPQPPQPAADSNIVAATATNTIDTPLRDQ